MILNAYLSVVTKCEVNQKLWELSDLLVEVLHILFT